MKVRNDRFSVVLMNPPYNGENRNQYGLHMQFLHKAISISESVVSIQPDGFLIKSYINKSPDKNERPVLTDINNYYSEIEVLPENTFDAKLQQELAIFNINRKVKSNTIKYINKFGEFKYTDALDITKYGKDPLTEKFKEIVLNNSNEMFSSHLHWIDKRNEKTIKERDDYDKTDLWYIYIATIRGHISPNSKTGKSDDFYSIIPANKQASQYDRYKAKGCYVNFDTYKEAANCINYLKTDFATFCNWLLKIDTNTKLNYLPWFDFSDPMFDGTPREIDDRLFKKFGISDEIRKHIEEILPDYYGIRK